jgi:glucan phosphorylase
MFGGRTEPYHDQQGHYRVRWMPSNVLRGVAYDTPVPGYQVPTTNLLRLWKAEATESFDLAAFNVGDYYSAVSQKVASETITKVLYPNDEPEAGKQLRPAAAVLLRLMLVAGHDSPASHAGKTARGVRFVLGRATQRHASVDRHR